jgi:hypothetical protein
VIYMPYPDYRRSAKCLSNSDLMQQRAACRRLIGVMHSRQHSDWQEWMSEWVNMGDAVLHATDATLEEMERRRMTGPFGVTPWMLKKNTPPPDWLGNKAFHDMYKTVLLRANPGHYGKMGWRVT